MVQCRVAPETCRGPPAICIDGRVPAATTSTSGVGPGSRCMDCTASRCGSRSWRQPPAIMAAGLVQAVLTQRAPDCVAASSSSGPDGSGPVIACWCVAGEGRWGSTAANPPGRWRGGGSRDACVARAVFNLHAVCGITRPCDAHSCSTEQALGGFAPHCTCSAPWPSSNRAAEPFASPSAKWWPLAPRSRQAQVMRWGSTHKSAATPASCCCSCCCCSCTRWSGRTGGWEPAHAVACTPAGIVGPCVKG